MYVRCFFLLLLLLFFVCYYFSCPLSIDGNDKHFKMGSSGPMNLFPIFWEVSLWIRIGLLKKKKLSKKNICFIDTDCQIIQTTKGIRFRAQPLCLIYLFICYNQKIIILKKILSSVRWFDYYFIFWLIGLFICLCFVLGKVNK